MTLPMIVAAVYVIIGLLSIYFSKVAIKYYQKDDDLIFTGVLISLFWPLSIVVIPACFIVYLIYEWFSEVMPKVVEFEPSRVIHNIELVLRDSPRSKLMEIALYRALCEKKSFNKDDLENILQVLGYKKQRNGVYTKFTFGKCKTIETLTKEYLKGLLT